jgi:peroxiredoxin
MRSDIVPGAIFPDYELSDHTAKRRKLSELQGQHPMVLVLSRGGFCPKDRRQAEGLVELHREVEVAHRRLVTISTDNTTLTNEYRSGVGAHWPFLSDAGRIVQKDLNIAEYADLVNNPTGESSRTRRVFWARNESTTFVSKTSQIKLGGAMPWTIPRLVPNRLVHQQSTTA